MRIFDRIEPTALDIREWQLWLLAFALICVLAVGTALLMFPSALYAPVVLSGATLRKSVFAFCALIVLLISYLVDRQLVITHLRRQLAQEEKTILRHRLEASTDLLGSLPDFENFQDRLTVEYRRASDLAQSFALVVVVLRSAQSLSEARPTDAVFGDAARALLRILRGEDSIYLFSPGVFCIVLPHTSSENSQAVSARLAEGLQDAAGTSSRFSQQIQEFNYPEHVKTWREIEEAIRPFIPMRSVRRAADGVEAVPTAHA